MKLSNLYINRKGELAYLPFAKKCDLCTLTVKPLADCVGVPGIEHIWFLKQRAVRDMYNAVKDDPRVKELWVFGSSTQMMCNYESDLDVAYSYDGDDKEFFQLLGTFDKNGVDRINLDTIEPYGPLYVQIKKGVRII